MPMTTPDDRERMCDAVNNQITDDGVRILLHRAINCVERPTDYVRDVLDEVKTAVAAQCSCTAVGCVHDQIREVIDATRTDESLLEALVRTLRSDIAEMREEAATERRVHAGHLGELHGLRSSENFFRDRCRQLEDIFEHLKEVWIAAQAWEESEGGMFVEARELSRAIRAAQAATPPILFSPEDRAALRALATWIHELEMMPEAGLLDAYFLALKVIDRIAPPEVKTS